MPHPRPPQQVAGDEEQHGGEGQESVPDFLPPAQHIEQRVILHQSEGNDIGQNPQDAFAVDVHGVLAVLVEAEGEDIGEFKPFQEEKAQSGLDEEYAAEQGAASGQHEEDCGDFEGRPGNPAGGHGVDEDRQGLEHPAEALQVALGAQDLQKEAAGAQHHPVELASAHHAGEGLQAPGPDLRQGEGHQDDGVAQQHLLEGIALHMGKALEHEVYAQEHSEGCQEAPHEEHEEGFFVLHLAAQYDGQVAAVEPQWACFFNIFLFVFVIHMISSFNRPVSSVSAPRSRTEACRWPPWPPARISAGRWPCTWPLPPGRRCRCAGGRSAWRRRGGAPAPA